MLPNTLEKPKLNNLLKNSGLIKKSDVFDLSSVQKQNSPAPKSNLLHFSFITFSSFPVNTTIYSCRIIMPGHALINANLYRQRLQSNGTRVTSINGASTAEAFVGYGDMKQNYQ